MAEGTILMTGATGALGKMLLPRLAQTHRVICVVRAENNEAAQARLSHYKSPRITGIAGDVTEPLCGLSEHDIKLLKGDITIMLHGAASISFGADAKSIRGIEQVNISGTRHALDLANRLNVTDFRYISTAYTAGNSPQFCENDLYISQAWRNHYENSKFVSESMVHAWAHEWWKAFTIYRPSILVGCEDGRTPTFDAYYGFLRPLAGLAEKMRERHKRGRSLPSDVHVRADGFVTLPVVMPAGDTSRLNLIPIDWVADMIAATLRRAADKEVYHLVHPDPPAVVDAFKWSLNALRIEGFALHSDPREEKKAIAARSPELQRLQERLLQPVLEQYRPYTTHSSHFLCQQTREMLGTAYREPIPVNEAFLSALLRYAEQTNWGGKQEVFA